MTRAGTEPPQAEPRPTTEAGRRLVALLSEARVEWPDEYTVIAPSVWPTHIFAIEAEARVSAGLDVERLRDAMGVFAFPPLSWPPDPSFIEAIVDEYNRRAALADGSTEKEGG